MSSRRLTRKTASQAVSRLAVPEAAIQEALARWLDTTGLLWCHVPNEGKRGRVARGRALRAGLKSGVPDVLVFGRTRDGELGLAIELKSEAGRMTSAQLWWRQALSAAGWRAEVCRSFRDAVALVGCCYDL